MARPRKPTELHVLEGTFRPDRHGDPPPAGGDEGERVNPPAPLRKLTKRKQVLWDLHVAKAPWLTETDSMMCMMYVELYAEWEKAPLQMATTRMQLFARMANDLGLSATSKNRVKVPAANKPANDNDEFFD